MRLQRALEENDRHKAMLKNAKRGSAEDVAALRQTVSSQEQQIKALERQRTELLGAFKKQLRLIDVLRRQKIHVEAARALAFTEQQFLETLEWT